MKHRLGVDDDDPRDRLFSFVETSGEGQGTTTFIVHARKAWLKGLSPKENRELPPLDYEIVAELKRERAAISRSSSMAASPTLDAAERELATRRWRHARPRRLSRARAAAAGRSAASSATTSRVRTADEAALDFRPWIIGGWSRAPALHSITRHMLGLFAGSPGARQWRRILSEKAPGARGAAAIAIYDEALEAVHRAPRGTAY